MATTKKNKPAAAKKPATAKQPDHDGHKAVSRSKPKHPEGTAAQPEEKRTKTTAKTTTKGKAKGKAATAAGKRTSAKPKAAGAERRSAAKVRKPKPASPHPARAAAEGNGHHERQAAQSPAPALAAGPKRPRTEREERISLGLFQALEDYASSHQLGRVMAHGRFDWGEIEDPGLDPDLAFVSFERWAGYRHVPTHLPWHVVPDLVVEIVRDSEETAPISRWLEAYFQAGVRRVWVVYPEQLKVHDYESVSASRVVGRDQALVGGEMLPGFQLPLRKLMADSAAH
jgi:Uma2 family endonuclease